MKKRLISVLAISSVLMLLGLWISLGLAGNKYVFTYPFLSACMLSILLSGAGLYFKQWSRPAFIAAAILLALLFIPASYALARWPGGDDGPGMAWLLFINGGSRIATLVSVGLLTGSIVLAIRKRKK